ncbi:hypothetical protein H4J02_06555 [Protaetiibacter sp. SSC-01]|uniref:hypothetical protein n=1 Tax=Protaetiibacter sp. SSC-01 TaxID=2759943 RepID=UPI0016569CBB|nr:hypothetical protein [Protaetiibacter sp. SSC-01]QNO38647.1 hypothetical protein H4J02_06555 [Protaetiibacter sp. SSC-01]
MTTETRPTRAQLYDSIRVARGAIAIDHDAAESYCKKWDLGAKNSKLARRFLTRFRGGEQTVTVVPWFDPTEDTGFVDLELAATGIDPRDFLFDKPSAIDVHPSTPREWLHSAPTVLVVPGCEEADRALASLLQPHSVASDIAALSADPAKHVAAMLARLPEAQRTLVIAARPQAFTSGHPVWFKLPFAGRTVWIHPERDVHADLGAWRRTQHLFSMLESSCGAQPLLVDLWQSETAGRALTTRASYGLAEFLAEADSWQDFKSLAVADLPPRPNRSADEAPVGAWRVTEDGLNIEEQVQLYDALNRPAGTRWEVRADIAAQVIGSDAIRRPTRDERHGGAFDERANVRANRTCRVKVRWLDDNGYSLEAEVEGPEVILEHPPTEWSSLGAKVPSELRLSSVWPIAGQDGRRWLRAIKAYRPEQPVFRTSWETMGWVPVPNDTVHAFIVGTQVLADNPRAEELTIAGVANVLAGADRFGVDDSLGAEVLADAAALERLRSDLRRLLDCYIESSPWSAATAAINLAVGLRPAMPVPTHAVVYHHGPPQKGKTWSARQQLAFWQARPGTWQHSVTGSAGDTPAASEDAASRTPIWVLDDLAPSSDRRRAAAQEDATGSMVRAVHNESAKRRMAPDMTTRVVNEPIALLVVTAENEASIRSIGQRMLRVQYDGLVSENILAMETLNYRSTTASRVTAALIRYLMAEGRREGWRELVRQLQTTMADDWERARAVLVESGVKPESSTRAAGIAADLMLGLRGLEMLLRHIGMQDDANRFSWNEGGLYRSLALHAAENAGDDVAPSPGKGLLDSIRGVLRAGHAHIDNWDHPGQPPAGPPASGSTHSHAECPAPVGETSWNQLLGWHVEDDTWKPRGRRIGTVKHVKNKGWVVIIFDEEAFNLAQRQYPERLPHGTKSRSAWKDLWQSGLGHPAWPNRQGGRNNVQFRLGDAAHYGQPFTLEQLVK